MGHIDNSGIVRTIYSCIFRHIQEYSAMSRRIKGHEDILRHIQATLCNLCFCNRAIFRTLAYLEPVASSSNCQICKIIRHIQSPGIIRTVYSSIFKDIEIYVYSGILMHFQSHSGIIHFAEHSILTLSCLMSGLFTTLCKKGLNVWQP